MTILHGAPEPLDEETKRLFKRLLEWFQAGVRTMGSAVDWEHGRAREMKELMNDIEQVLREEVER